MSKKKKRKQSEQPKPQKRKLPKTRPKRIVLLVNSDDLELSALEESAGEWQQ